MSFAVTLFVFFCLVISAFISRYMFPWEEVIEAYVYRSSLTFILHFPRVFFLLPTNTVSLTTRLWVTHAKTKKKTSASPSCLFLIFWTHLQRFFRGIMNRIVKSVWFVSIWGLSEQKQWCKRIKNLYRVFLDKHAKRKKILEDTWRDWV